MAERTATPPSAPAAPAAPNILSSLSRLWQQISPRIVPVLAVLTALIITVPFMVLTGGEGSISQGLNIAGTAYAALIEGSTGLAINDLLSPNDLALARTLAEQTGLTRNQLRGLATAFTNIATTPNGEQQARQYADALARVTDLDDEQLVALGERIPDILTIGRDRLEQFAPLILELDALDRGHVRALVEDYAAMDELSAEDRAALEAVAPSAADYSDEDHLAAMELVNDQGVVALGRALEQIAMLDQVELDPDSPEAAALTEIAALQGGAGDARDLAEAITFADAAGIIDLNELAEQLTITRELYSQDLLTFDDVAAALTAELPQAIEDNLIVQRPGNRLLIDRTSAPAGIIYTDNSTPDDTSDDRPDTVYLRLGPSALLFFPINLETTIVRSIPFIIAGLAVALGFKAGLFNIGAEGQLYMGAILGVYVGFAPAFAGLPAFIHVPLIIAVGILGGALWGAIPGVLKAYTGAHEVITTIMLNFIAILFVDWLIKSPDPVVLLDINASTPRTPFISPSAELPTFDQFGPLVYLAAGVIVAAIGLATQRRMISKDPRYAIRPIVYGILTTILGLFLSWTAVRGNLHFGFVIMLAAVWFTDWFLNRTTPGFELRTVGSNPDAARYAGMNVRWNIIFAMVLSGGLAGLAGVIEISGVQHNMQPLFFAGLGFDAIAVALLARSNPRNMIWAGLLWGALLTGAGLMQVRADISIDLVKIIQALIIMFIAADAIIRYVWRVPRTGERVTMFSKGWGG